MRIMRDLVIYGVMLQVGSQFVCWNSHKASFYLGNKNQSEIFNDKSLIHFIYGIDRTKLTQQAYTALSLYPTAKIVDITKEP